MKIAMIGQKGIPSIHGGIETHVEELSTRLANRGHQVTVYCRKNYTPPIGEFRGVRIIRFPSVKTKHLDTITYCFIATFDSLFRDFDVVHFHALGPSIFSFLPRLKGCKTIVTVHALDWRQKKWGAIARQYLKACEITSCYFPNHTIAVSRRLKDYLEKRFDRKVVYLPSGIREPERGDGSFLEEMGLKKKGYILFVGRLIPDKGVHLLIDAHQTLKLEIPLVIVGEGFFTDDYVRKLKGMASRGVIWTGFLHGKRLWELYENALLFVLPSNVEGLSISILEAMNTGTPVLASDIEENLEIINAEGGPYGFTFKNNDTTSLKKVLSELLSDVRRLEDMSARAKEFVAREYSWDSIISKLESLYSE